MEKNVNVTDFLKKKFININFNSVSHLLKMAKVFGKKRNSSFGYHKITMHDKTLTHSANKKVNKNKQKINRKQ